MCINTIYEEAVVGIISLAPTYTIICYENILFDIRPLFWGHKQSINFLQLCKLVQ